MTNLAHELLVRLKHAKQLNDHEATILIWGELYATYRGPFIEYISKLKYKYDLLPLDDAEDIAQDTFIKILHEVDSYREEGREGQKSAGGEGWMKTICRRLIIDIIRERAKKKSIPIDDVPEDALIENDPVLQSVDNELLQAVQRTLESISLEDQIEIIEKGPNPGKLRNTYKEALKRARATFETFYKPNQQS